MLEVLADVAAQSVVPRLADRDELEAGNARLMAVQTGATQLVGPGVGGWLTALSLPLPFVFNACTFLTSALVLRRLRGCALKPLASARDPLREQVVQGLRAALHDRVVRLLMLIVAGLGLLDGMVGAVLVLFALEELGTSQAGYGFLLSVAAVGSIVGTLAAPRLARRVPVRGLLVAATLCAGVSYIAMSGADRAPVAAALLALHSAAVMLWNVLTVAVRQRVVAPDLLGRVTATYRMAAWGTLPVGALLGGLLASSLGLRHVVLIAGVGTVLLAAVVLRLPGPALTGDTPPAGRTQTPHVNPASRQEAVTRADHR